MHWCHCGENTDWEQQTPFKSIVAAPHSYGEIDGAALDKSQGSNTALFDEMDLDTRSRLQIPCEEWRQHVLDDLRRGSDTEAADFAAAHRLCIYSKLLDAREYLTAPAQEALAGACHTNPAPHTLKEGDTQLELEVANLPPQRRLSDVQPSGGSGEGARLGDCDEVAKVTEFHFVCCLEGIDYRAQNALDSAAVPSLTSW
jgi:hypothetical protein